jgi:adenosine deaminase/aminodeoxyfutalosine deaminase
VPSFYELLPKAELHVHLEGSIEPETLRELAPELSPDAVAARYQYSDFAGFLDAFKWVAGFLRTPDDYALATRRLLESMHRQNIRYAEITLSAGVVLWKKQDFAAIYDAVVKQAARSTVDVWWVLDAIRHFGPDHAMDVARLAVERAGHRVVAFGIGGDEARGPAFDLAGALSFAAANGLKLVPHAGETTGPESVWDAVQHGAARIGHGIAAAADPALMRHLRDCNIPLEICVSSNLATGAVANLQAHPVRRLFDAGVPIILNTDDPAMFQTTLVNEFDLAERELGFSRAELTHIARSAFDHALSSSARSWLSELPPP